MRIIKHKGRWWACIFPAIAAITLTIPLVFAAEAETDYRYLWQGYRDSFIQQDGRVIDNYQKDFSHSEAQAFGLNLALKFNDRQTFGRILEWNRNNLQCRKKDNLLCWSWGKRPGGMWLVRDYNNASDADLLTALALIKAGRKWGEPSLTRQGLDIARDIRRLLFMRSGAYTLLLPGFSGFIKGENALEYNPSYFIPEAFRTFAEAGDAPEFWNSAIEHGFSIQTRCTYGQFKLPPDWILIKSGELSLPGARPPKYGYDAVRIWLYTANFIEKYRGKLTAADPVRLEPIEKLLNFARAMPIIPAEVMLDHDCLCCCPAPAGFLMIYARAMHVKGNRRLAEELRKRAFEKLNAEKKDYYSQSLFLLALY